MQEGARNSKNKQEARGKADGRRKAAARASKIVSKMWKKKASKRQRSK